MTHNCDKPPVCFIPYCQVADLQERISNALSPFAPNEGRCPASNYPRKLANIFDSNCRLMAMFSFG